MSQRNSYSLKALADRAGRQAAIHHRRINVAVGKSGHAGRGTHWVWVPRDEKLSGKLF